jgi:hypothetical protein
MWSLTDLHPALLTLVFALTVTTTPIASAQSGVPAGAGRNVACSASGTILYDDHDGTVHNLQQLFKAEKFADLDAALDCLSQSLTTFKSGRLGSSAVYWLWS